MNREQLIELAKKPMKKETYIKRVEIIMFVYKSPETEKKSVNLIIDHTTHPYKLVVYDNRLNTCNTAKMWNKLVKTATCPYICIMDSDAYVEEGWLEKLMSVFKLNQKIAVVCAVTGNDPRTNLTIHQFKEKTEEQPYKVTDDISGYCYLVKRKIVQKLKFDEDFYVFGQDSDFFKRVIEKGYKIYLNPQVKVEHGGSLSTRKAYDEGEFDWDIDSQYARELVQKKFEERKLLKEKTKKT